MADYNNLHDWTMSPREAVEFQKRMREQVRLAPPAGRIGTIAGADISFNKYSSTIYAGIVVLDAESLETVEEVGIVGETHFPYVPGLLSFREIPPLLRAWERLRITPDAVMMDGQGIAHPRRFGIASHFGLLVGRPCFGCAKSVLTGKFEEPGIERGSWSPMTDKGEEIGAAVRTKRKVRPVYISPGHLIDLKTAIALALACDGGYRIPEPTRRAHLLVNAVRRGEREPT